MTKIQRKMHIIIMVVLNSICFSITAIKEYIIYPKVLKDNTGNNIEWNEILLLLWRYSEIAIIIVVATIAIFYWFKRKEVVFLDEIKITGYLFLTIVIVEVGIGKLLNLPMGNVIQATRWLLYVMGILLLLLVIKKLKINKKRY